MQRKGLKVGGAALAVAVVVALVFMLGATERRAKALLSADQFTRERAAIALGQHPNRSAVDALVGALGDSAASVRRLAAWALGRIGDSRAVSALTGVLEDDDILVRQAAVQALGSLRSTDATEPLCALAQRELTADDRNELGDIADALRAIGDPRAAPTLVAMLAREDAREPAALALVYLRAAAIEPLAAALFDGDASQQEYAAQVLGRINDPRGVEPLIRRLSSISTTEREGLIEGEAAAAETATALGASRDPRGAETLLATLERFRDVGVAPRLRRALADALGWSGARATAEPLSVYLTHRDIAPQVAAALRRLEWEPGTDSQRVHFWIADRDAAKIEQSWDVTRQVLLADLDSGNWNVMSNAAVSFIELGVQDGLPDLLRTLEKRGDESLAMLFLNCGHDTLADAGRDWALNHGYEVRQWPSTGGSQGGWGTMPVRVN